MIIRQLKFKVYLLKDIPIQRINTVLANLIDHCLIENGKEDFHKENKYKMYCFDSLMPLDPVYKEGHLYSFRVRVMDQELAAFLKQNLTNTYNDQIKVLSSEERVLAPRQIDEIQSITPVICTFECGYWRNSNSQIAWEDRISKNLEQKYYKLTGKKVPEGYKFYEATSFLNHKPIKVPMKNIHLLGDKAVWIVKSEPLAQELAKIAIGTGIGEKNPRGFGFVKYN